MSISRQEEIIALLSSILTLLLIEFKYPVIGGLFFVLTICNWTAVIYFACVELNNKKD